MASISTDYKGNRKVLFTGVRGKRDIIYLGNATMKAAKGVKDRIESILRSKKLNIPFDWAVVEWLAGLPASKYDRLAFLRLVETRDHKQTTLGQFIDDYHAKRTDWKPNSVKNHKAAKRWLLKFWSPSVSVTNISEGDADDFRLFLSGQLGENTVRRTCGFARQYFRAMKRKRLIQDNPFEGMKRITVEGNPARMHFVARATIDRVLLLALASRAPQARASACVA